MSEDHKSTYPGHLLREARKRKRLRFRKLSSELRIPQTYLEALEENDYSLFAGPTYIKGYLRAYSRKLDLDPELVLKAFDQYLKDQRKEKKTAIKEEKVQKTYKLIFLAAIVSFIILICIFLYMFIPNDKNDKPEAKIATESVIDTDQLVFEDLVEKNKVLKETEEVITKDITPLNSLKLIIYDECWIEIMDKHSIIEYQLAKAGSSVEVKGEGPFKVIIGNSTRALLFYNEQQIDLFSTTNAKTNVSCLVLPTGNCNEFTLSN